MARGKAEGYCSIISQYLGLADEVVAGGVADFHRTLLHRVEHLEPRYDLARGEGADLELPIGELAHPIGQHIGCPEDGIEAFGEAARQPPANARGGLRENRAKHRAGCYPHTSFFEEIASIHIAS